jgi:hypothetical protein
MSKASPSGQATMTKSEKIDGNTIEHPPETLQVVEPAKAPLLPCVVGCSAGKTIQTQPFNNIKIGVYLSVTVEPNEIDEAWDMVSSWVGDKLGEMEEAVSQAMGG